jgi:hypothetical protein
MSDETPGWRTGLSICFAAIAIIRLIFTCSDMNRRNNVAIDNNTISPYSINAEQFKTAIEENKVNVQIEQKKIATNIMYAEYKGVDSLSSLQKENYGLYKLKKDSLVYIGFTTQMKIPKAYYLQNNHDDSLRIAFKSPDNLNIFIHDFDSKEDLEQSLKSLKRQSNLQKYKLENTIGKQTKVVSYKISKDNKRFNGYALCFKSESGDLQTFFEFESNKLSKEELKEKALDFLQQNLKEKK